MASNTNPNEGGLPVGPGNEGGSTPGGGGYAGGGIETTANQSKVGLIVAVVLGGLVILGAVLKFGFKLF